eukprot:CAMPEP_0178874006 /NCGR_PEP_ID=MMETSP0747-20121128/8986_1 /TAXON_ID=913974 /ORGANISM="Nitzschia punctata, Strain CCMP561" /LENGTH=407 /DNA_ID=CAMNT_0020541377 /DNA_START=163 /DNA_END=1386 /DNA_ORIENTATION=-
MIGVAAGLSFLYLLEETNTVDSFAPSSPVKTATGAAAIRLFQDVDHSYPLRANVSNADDKKGGRQQPSSSLLSWLSSGEGLLPFLRFQQTQSNEEAVDVPVKSTATRRREDVLNDGATGLAYFPTLKSRIIRSDTGKSIPFPINSNRPIPIDNDLFVGHVSLVLRPFEPSHDPLFESRLRQVGNVSNDNIKDNKNNLPTFYFHLEGRFKRPVSKESLFVGAELADPHVMKTTLSPLTRRFAALLLRLLSINIGPSMLYSFGGGGENGKELPHIAFPIHAALRIQKQNVAEWNAETNHKQSSTNEHQDSLETYDTRETYSFSYNAQSIDLVTWRVLLPFEMHVSRFWGTSPLRLVIYEKQTQKSALEQKSPQKNNYLFELQLEHLGMPEQEHDAISKSQPRLLSTSPM